MFGPRTSSGPSEEGIPDLRSGARRGRVPYAFQVAGRVYDPHYTLKDRDATYLPKATRVSVVRFSPRFRLAATRADRH